MAIDLNQMVEIVTAWHTYSGESISIISYFSKHHNPKNT